MEKHPFNERALPHKLKCLKQWVIVRNGVPKNAKYPDQNAKSNDSSTLSSFDQAIAAFRAGHGDGIAFVFTADDCFVGIDLDSCRDPLTGTISDWAQQIVDEFPTYTEVSGSGTGLHLLFEVKSKRRSADETVKNFIKKHRNVTALGEKLPETRVSQDRLALTLTTRTLPDRTVVRELTKAFRRFLKRHFPRKKASRSRPSATRQLTSSEQETLSRLLADSETGEDRSGGEFYAACSARKMGISALQFWKLARNYGKFKERGLDYFKLTWKKAGQAIADGISNAVTLPDGKHRGLQLEQIIATILLLTGNWPRRVGGTLFVHDPVHGITFLRNPAALFAWLHTAVGNVLWFSCASCVTKEELFHALLRVARSYDAIHELPHEPPISNYYYTVLDVPVGDGQTFEGLIDCFEPETPLDRTLIMAAFLTLAWGGSAGARPIIVLTAAGRGHGKTTLAALIGLLFGGFLTFSKGEDIGVIIQRLLSPEGMKALMVLLDNLKTTKFSWAEFEALVTSLVISGKAMYIGEASRPNHLTYFITGNSLALSTDIAQRSVIVRLGKPTHSGNWFADIRDFITEHRLELIADMIAILRRKGVSLPQHTRWGEWEDGVLAKLPNAVEAQRLIIARRGESDVEAATAATVEEFIQKRLTAAGYDTERQRIRIPTEIVVNWFNTATEQSATVSHASAMLRQMAEEGQLKRLKKNPSHKQSRSFIWTGSAFDGRPTVDFERRPRKS